jgi:hypothetical protein
MCNSYPEDTPVSVSPFCLLFELLSRTISIPSSPGSPAIQMQVSHRLGPAYSGLSLSGV